MTRPASRVSGWRRRFADLWRARWAPAVAAGLVGLFGLVVMAGGVERTAWWYLTFGLQRSEVCSGKVWQVATHALLHGNWSHVMLNSLMVWLLGARLERMLGKGVFLKALACGIAGGAAGHLLLAPGAVAASPLVGISGGCMGLLLTLTTLSPESRMLPLPVSGRNLGLGIIAAELLFAVLDPQLGIPGLAVIGGMLADHGWESWFQVGHACHLGGCLGGWWFARSILRPGPTLAELRAERARLESRLPPPGAPPPSGNS